MRDRKWETSYSILRSGTAIKVRKKVRQFGLSATFRRHFEMQSQCGIKYVEKIFKFLTIRQIVLSDNNNKKNEFD
jgi:hypothetical protein